MSADPLADLFAAVREGLKRLPDPLLLLMLTSSTKGVANRIDDIQDPHVKVAVARLLVELDELLGRTMALMEKSESGDIFPPAKEVGKPSPAPEEPLFVQRPGQA